MTDQEWAQAMLREMKERGRNGSVNIDYQHFSCGDGVNYLIWDEGSNKVCQDADRETCYLIWTAHLQKLQEVTK